MVKIAKVKDVPEGVQFIMFPINRSMMTTFKKEGENKYFFWAEVASQWLPWILDYEWDVLYFTE